MTDLAATLANLATTADALGLTRADLAGIQITAWETHITLHLRAATATRIVANHGDPATHTVLEHTDHNGSVSHHHRVTLAGSNSNIQILWVTLEAAESTATQAA